MRTRKGFTLIELMIVIAIIAIIAAIAIPNLMQSRIRANEATAISAMKNYVTAQVTFQVGKNGRSSANTNTGASGYADNYRMLFYGSPLGALNVARTDANLELISQAHADACVQANPQVSGKATVSLFATVGGLTPYNGYSFDHPSDFPAATDFETDFGLVGAPANSGTTGNNWYYIGQQGMVYAQALDPGDSASATVAKTTPRTTAAGWLAN